MADEGGPAAPSAPAAGGGGVGVGGPTSVPAHAVHNHKSNGSVTNGPMLEEIASLTSPRLFTPNPFSRKNTSLDVDDYFVRSPRIYLLLPQCRGLTWTTDRSP